MNEMISTNKMFILHVSIDFVEEMVIYHNDDLANTETLVKRHSKIKAALDTIMIFLDKAT